MPFSAPTGDRDKVRGDSLTLLSVEGGINLLVKNGREITVLPGLSDDFHSAGFTLLDLPFIFCRARISIRPDLVLEGIVSVCLFDAESRVGVARPASAEVEAFIDPPDPVFPADSERRCVILTVAHIEKSDFAHEAGVESPRGTQTVDAQRIVVTVLIGPFAVVDEARRNLLQPGIDEGIGADHHGIVALTEHVDHLLQGAGAAVKIVRIELNGIAAAGFVLKGLVPATTDAKIGPLRDDVLQAGILPGEIGEDGRCSVCRVVVHNDDVEWKIRFLRQGAFHGLGNRFFPVPHGNDDRGLHRKGFRCLLDLPEVMGWQISPDLLQVIREDGLHFLLDGFISGIDVRKYLFTVGDS